MTSQQLIEAMELEANHHRQVAECLDRAVDNLRVFVSGHVLVSGSSQAPRAPQSPPPALNPPPAVSPARSPLASVTPAGGVRNGTPSAAAVNLASHGRKFGDHQKPGEIRVALLEILTGLPSGEGDTMAELVTKVIDKGVSVKRSHVKQAVCNALHAMKYAGQVAHEGQRWSLL